MDEIFNLIIQSPEWLLSNIARGTVPKKTLFFVFGFAIPAGAVGYIFFGYLESLFWRLAVTLLTGLVGFGIAAGVVYLYYDFKSPPRVKNPPPENQEIAVSIRSMFSDPKKGGIPKKGSLLVLGISILTGICIFFSSEKSLGMALICGGLVFLLGAVAAGAYYKS